MKSFGNHVVYLFLKCYIFKSAPHNSFMFFLAHIHFFLPIKVSLVEKLLKL